MSNLPDYEMYGIQAAQAEIERLKEYETLFNWWFGDTNKDKVIPIYLNGIKEGWSADRWKTELQNAMKSVAAE